MKANAADIARICDVDVTTVRRWVERGLPAEREGGKGRELSIDVGDAVRHMKRQLLDDVERLRAAASGEGAKERKAAAEARLAELKVKREEASLVPADEVRDRWVEVLSAVRAGVLAIPATAVQSGLVTRENETLLDQLVRDALVAISKAPASE